MKNETAVEYLFKLIDDFGINKIDRKAILKMEKKQLIESGDTCAFRMRILCDKIDKMTDEEIKVLADQKTNTLGEEYYKETYS